MSALDVLKAAGADRVVPDILIDAGVPLNLSGEAVRGRICTFTDASGREWALRPDLTLPVALGEIASRQSGQTGSYARSYSGPVFRLPAAPGEPVEYEQIGIERFGFPSTVDTDCALVALLAQACQAEGVTAFEMRCGDLSLFPTFIDALGLSLPVASALKRAYRQEGGVRAYLDGRKNTGKSQGFSQRLEGMSRADVESLVEDIFALTGLQPVGLRTGDEIVERLIQKQAEADDASLSDDRIERILALLAIDVSLAEAPQHLREVAQGLNTPELAAALSAFETRAEQVLQNRVGGAIQSVRFATRFGRRFTYYDGFMFEFFASGCDGAADLPIAAGGRYDSLLEKLSDGEIAATAIGGIVIPHRLRAAVGAST